MSTPTIVIICLNALTALNVTVLLVLELRDRKKRKSSK